MGAIEETLYRHERLAPGAFHVPDTVHMHFNLGAHRDVQRKLCEKLVRFGATPKESLIVEPSAACIISFPVSLKDELASYGWLGLQFLDDLDVEPCSAQLERVIAHLDANGRAQIAEATDSSSWMPLKMGYVASLPGTIEVHHSVCFPKNGEAPPISLSQLLSRTVSLGIPAWSLFEKPGSWCIRSSKPIRAGADIAAILIRDREKLSGLLNDVAPHSRIEMTVEQTMASWDYPLQASEENRSRVSLKQMTGTSERRLPNLSDIVFQCKAASAHKLLVRDEASRSRIIANLEPFRRIVIAQGLDPAVIALGLIPATAENDMPRFADHFCSQVAVYRDSNEEAEAMLEAYRSAIWFLVQSGSSPIMSYDDRYDKLFFWSALLPGPKQPVSKSARKNGGKTQPAIAAGEQVFSVAPIRQYKRAEETLEFLTAAIGRSEKSKLSNAGILVVPLRTGAQENGEHLRGCLFALVSSPGADTKLDRKQLAHLAACESIMLHRAPFRSNDPVQPLKPATEVKPALRARFDPVRIQHVMDHEKLWNAIEALWGRPGSRIRRMAQEFPDAFELFRKYPQLEKLKGEVDSSTKMTAIVESLWTAMTNTDRSGLYSWRKKAGLPSRRPR